MTPEITAEITMREARREDVARIAQLIMLGASRQTRSEAEIATEAAHPAYLAAFDEILESKGNTLFVAERDGHVVGTVQVTIIPGLVERGRKRAKLESVHIDPAHRGRGLGAVMVGLAEDFARSQGARLIELTSNKSRGDAHRFYTRLGFDQSHEGFKKVFS